MSSHFFVTRLALGVGVSILTTTACVRSSGPRPVATAARCDAHHACPNTYYWDHARGVYVYFDGYRYRDALGGSGSVPLPPSTSAITYPPSDYVPPTPFRAPSGTYRPPPAFRPPPQDFYVRETVAAEENGRKAGVPDVPQPPANPAAPRAEPRYRIKHEQVPSPPTVYHASERDEEVESRRREEDRVRDDRRRREDREQEDRRREEDRRRRYE